MQQLSKKTIHKFKTEEWTQGLLTLREILGMSPCKLHLSSFLETENTPIYYPVQLKSAVVGRGRSFSAAPAECLSLHTTCCSNRHSFPSALLNTKATE